MTTVLVCIFALKEVRGLADNPVYHATSKSPGKTKLMLTVYRLCQPKASKELP
jgi:hypothetical protein